MEKYQPSVFCVEGEWGDLLTDESSVEPLLDLLERVARVPHIYRRVPTIDALKHYVRQWADPEYAEYSVGSFAFHGSAGLIEVGGEQLTLTQLATQLRDTCRGRVVHFSSCGTIDVLTADVDQFRRVTGARAVSGYIKEVDWLESAAFDLLVLAALTRYQRGSKIERWLRTNFGDACDHLGFKTHYGARSGRTA